MRLGRLGALALALLALGRAYAQDSGEAAKVYTGVASWYGAEFQGRQTSNGEVYDKEAFTAAHLSLAFGTLLVVRNLDNGASVVVRVNDRGPFVPGRVLDLSEAAARVLGLTVSGTARVSFQAISPAEAAAFGVPGPSVSANAPPGPAQAAPAGQAGLGTCRIQIASFKDSRNAKATLERLKNSGIVASLEEAPPYTRVVMEAVKGSEVEALAERLRSLGYRSLLITWR